jgi:hypothetical protein
MSFRQEVRDFIHGYDAADKWDTAASNRRLNDARTDALKPAPYDPGGPGLPEMAGGPLAIPEHKDDTETSGTKKAVGKYDTPMENAGGRQIGQQVYNYYRKAGLSHPAAAGWTANFMQESGGDLRVVAGDRRGDNGKSAYIAQWQGPRLANLEAFAKERGNPKPTLKDQLDFALEEGNPNSPYKDDVWSRNAAALDGMKTAEDAVAHIRQFFERPSADDLQHRLGYLKGIVDDGSYPTPATDGSTTPSTEPEKPEKKETVGPDTDPGSDPEHQSSDPYSPQVSFDLPEVAIPEVAPMFVPTDDEALQLAMAQQQQEIEAGGESPWIDTSEVRPAAFAAKGGVIPEPTQMFAGGGMTYTAAPIKAPVVDPNIRRVGQAPIGTGAASAYANGARTSSQLALDKARAAVPAPAPVAAAPAAPVQQPGVPTYDEWMNKRKMTATKAYHDVGNARGPGWSTAQRNINKQRNSWDTPESQAASRKQYETLYGAGGDPKQQEIERRKFAGRSLFGIGFAEGGVIPEPGDAPVQSYARGGLAVDPNLWQKAVKREGRTSGRAGEAGMSTRDTAAKRLNVAGRGVVSSAIDPANRHERRKAGRKGDQHKRGGEKRKKDKIETSSTPTPTPAQPKKGRLSDEYVRPTDTPPPPGRLSDENASPPVPGESYAGQETTPRPRPNYPYPADPGRREINYPYPADPGRREVGYPYNPDNAIPDGSYAGEETAFRVPGEYHAGEETTPRPRPNYPYNPDNGPVPGEARAGQEQAPGALPDWYVQMLQRQSEETGIPLETLIIEARGNAAASVRDAVPEGEEATPMENPPDWYNPAKPSFKRGGAVPEEDELPLSPRAEEAAYSTSAPGGVPAPAPAQAAPAEPAASSEAAPEQERLRPTPTLMSAVKEAIAGGSQFIQRHFGLNGGGEGGGVDPVQTGGIPDPEAEANAQAGITRFARGEGAATQDEVQAIDQTLDLPRGMAEGDKNMERMARVVNWYLQRGRKDDAEAAAASLMMYGANRTAQLGGLAQVAYEDGNIDKTIKYLEEAYKMIPDGGSLDVTVDREAGKFYAEFTDQDGNVREREVTSQEIPGLIQQVQNKSAYWTSVARLGDPKGAEKRDRLEEQRINDERDAKIRRAEKIDERAYNEKNWNYQHGVEREEELTDEQRKARADELKETEKRGYEAGLKASEYKQERRDKLADDVTERQQKATDAATENIEEQQKERRANEENDRRTLRDARIAIMKTEADPSKKPIDWETINGPFMQARAAEREFQADKTPEKQAAYEEALSRLWDTLPDNKDRPDTLAKLGFFPEDLKYTPEAGSYLPRAEGDTPPAGFEDAKPDMEDGKPVWVVTRDGQEYILQDDGK